MTRTFSTFVILTLMLSACGVKPGSVDPPGDVKHDEFPRTYPDMQTDPQPYIPPR